jgi:ABC-2 type transport system ATP-binding protein
MSERGGREPGDTILNVDGVTKTYASGLTALEAVSLDIRRGEILGLLGPNGAGKTTLISIICGLVSPSSGTVKVDGSDIVRDYRRARSLIGLVPQEIALEPFETVMSTLRFSRGLFGKPRDDAYLEKVLKTLTLWDKRDAQLRALSGGMKRRVMIAKALAHQPRILFLDEPTAGVDVDLRREMWEVVRGLKADGVTIILTTHYIDEAEAIADRVGIISEGRILLVEEKHSLMHRLGRRQMKIALDQPVSTIPESLSGYNLEHGEEPHILYYMYDEGGPAIGALLADMAEAGLTLEDVETRQRSLEDIFVELVKNGGGHGRDAP